MTELQRTGFFREMPHGEPTDPSLAEARNPTASPHEDRIAGYLEAGRVYLASPGVTHDVLDPGTAIGPPRLVTDGRFVWPGELAHYVRRYHVRLDGAIIEHMLASGWTVPSELDLTTLVLPARAAAPVEPAADAPSKPDLAAAVARLLGSLSGSRGTGSDARATLKKSFEEAGDGLARAAESFGNQVGAALETAGANLRTHLSSSLRSLSDWLDKPEDERNRQLQAAMASLQAKLDEVLAPERRAETAEHAREIREKLEAWRREHGLDPGGPGGPGGPGEPGDDK